MLQVSRLWSKGKKSKLNPKKGNNKGKSKNQWNRQLQNTRRKTIEPNTENIHKNY